MQLPITMETTQLNADNRKYAFVDEQLDVEFPGCTLEEKVHLKNLSVQQRDWVLAYISTGSKTEACRRTGYSTNANSVTQLWIKPQVQLYFRKIYEMIEKDQIMNAQEIMVRLSQFAKGQVDEECLFVLQGQGMLSEVTNVSKAVSPSYQLKALELLAKMQGMLIENHQHNVNINVPRIVDDI